MSENEIWTGHHVVGRYKFVSILPCVGKAGDKVKWLLFVDDVRQPHAFDELESALFAAACWKSQEASKAVLRDARIDPAQLQKPMTI